MQAEQSRLRPGGAGKGISASAPDWSREAVRQWWDPPRKLLRALRRHQAARARGGIAGRIAARWWAQVHRFWSVITQADIPLGCRIGGGLLLLHPNGIVIHPEAEIGPNCLILQQVTIGVREGRAGAPSIGGHVDIGAGARVLGPVRVGDHAVIGANAVVIGDVPDDAVAVGVPARLLRTE